MYMEGCRVQVTGQIQGSIGCMKVSAERQMQQPGTSASGSALIIVPQPQGGVIIVAGTATAARAAACCACVWASPCATLPLLSAASGAGTRWSANAATKQVCFYMQLFLPLRLPLLLVFLLVFVRVRAAAVIIFAVILAGAWM